MTRWRALGLAVIVVLVASGCSNDDNGGGSTTCITDGSVDIGGCVVVVVRFAEPVNLARVEAAALGANGVPVAVWRTDAVCVHNPSFGSPIGVPTASAFAYWHADQLVERQNEGPPPTDGGYSHALRDRFEEEWIAASRAGVTFAGAALYLPTAAAPPDATRIEWHRTDVVGVLYLRGDEQAMAPFFPTPQADC
ncbi:MAG: hypothetical protein ACRD0V_08060 [Acidimicrobiales bacterium]